MLSLARQKKLQIMAEQPLYNYSFEPISIYKDFHLQNLH